MKRFSKSKRTILTAFVAAAIVVVSLTVSIWKIAKDATKASELVTHAHEVLDLILRANNDATKVEYASQNFRLSGEAHWLAERDSKIIDREKTLERIKILTADDANQQENWMRLRNVVNDRIAISKHSELIRKTEGYAAATAYIATAPLIETRQRMYSILSEMENREMSQLEMKNRDFVQARIQMASISSGVALLLLFSLGGTYLLFLSQLRTNVGFQRALADSEENLSTTLHSIGDAVLATDKNAHIIRMNPVAELLTGWDFVQAKGRHVDEVLYLINEPGNSPISAQIAEIMAGGEHLQALRHTALVSRNHHHYPIAGSVAAICNSCNQISGTVIVFRDETNARQAQKIILEQNETLELRVRERSMQLLESEQHLKKIINSVPALIAFVDAHQRYVYVNQQYHERFAAEKADISGKTVEEILGKNRYAIAAPMIKKVLRGRAQTYDWQPFPGIWQAINYIPKHDAEGIISGYYVLGLDITERKHAEEKINTLNNELEQQVYQLESVSRALCTISAGNKAMLYATNEQALLDSMCKAIVDVGNYAMAIVLYRIDDEFKTMMPMAETGFPGGLAGLHEMKVSWGNNPYGRGVVATAVRTSQTSVVADLQSDPYYVLWFEKFSPCACAIACPLHVEGKTIGAIAVYASEKDAFGDKEVALLSEMADDLAFGLSTLRGREEKKKTRLAIERLTRFDTLTELPNETQFVEFIVAAINSGEQQAFTILQTNIERLNEINVALGFNQGDQLIKELGARLRQLAPGEAIVARLRGDEFGILLPDCGTEGAIACVQEIEKSLQSPFMISGIPIDVSVKIGVALFPLHGNTPHDLLRFTDMAAMQAKRQSADYVIFDPVQNQDQARHLNMAGELKHAIEAGDLRLYLQPKVEMSTGRVCGAEGLVRWKHATRGLIPPGEFISLAEHTGLIKPLTEWVVETALRLNQTWGKDGKALPIAVNLSSRNLRDDKLVGKILHLQEVFDAQPGLLEIEITESMVMDDAEFSLQVLRELRAIGISMYIDDFGTGYSSLSYLQKLPVDYIKIDQSFVSMMTESKESSRIVQSTIDLAHDLGRKVVAEGVETQQQWDQLALYGCDFVQGYFIARPMPADEFQNWVEHFQHTHLQLSSCPIVDTSPIGTVHT